VPWTGAGVQLLQLAVIGSLAEVSWRLVERPIRTGRFAAGWRAMDLGGRRFVAGAVTAAAVLLVAAMVTAPGPDRPWWEGEPQVVSASGVSPVLLAPAPTTTSPRAPDATVAAPVPEPTSTTTTAAPPPAPAVAVTSAPRVRRSRPSTTTTAPAPAAEAAPTTAAPPPPPAPAPRDLSALAIGDSVMVAARNALVAEGGAGVLVDAEVGRQNDATLTVLQRYRDDGTLATVEHLVVHIGTNGPFTQKQFDRLVALTADVPDVVVVNVRVPKSWQAQSNATIADNVPAHPRMRIADWHEASGQPGVVGSDGVHPTPSGARLYARLALAAAPEPPPPPPAEEPPPPEPEPDPATTTTTTEAPPSTNPTAPPA
jgi:outer membrane biosynthesis protein TonB